METFLSALLGELATRSVNFFITKSCKRPERDVENRLRRVLLRAQVILDEAIGRHITNQGMLLQLDVLRDAMHRGYYMLDTLRYQSHGEENAKDQIVSRSWSLSKNSAKGPYFLSRSAHILEQLQEALDRLSSMIVDVHELVVFLTSYPCLYRQPYSMHLLLGNCMFGRQVEAELVVNFLLHTQSHGAGEMEVLPIVGPGRVGKSTLIAHVCKDEGVCDHFSEIFFLRNHDFTGDELAKFRERCVREHQDHVSSPGNYGRLLVVVEVVGDLNEDAWNRLHSAFNQCMSKGSKMVVTSRSDKIVKFGTTGALNLKYLSCEAYWYFFKTVLFGSMDPETQPIFAHLSMEIASTLKGSLIGANLIIPILRNNFDIRFWRKVLTFIRGFTEKHISKFGRHPIDLLNQTRPTRMCRMATPSEHFVVCHQCETPSEGEVPMIKLQDVVYGTIKPHGKFEVLAWTSRIPPYYNYVYTCEMGEPETTAVKRKRSVKNVATPC